METEHGSRIITTFRSGNVVYGVKAGMGVTTGSSGWGYHAARPILPLNEKFETGTRDLK